jgi:hypothetical protein
LVPIEAPTPQDKGKGKEIVKAMDKGKSEKERSPIGSMTSMAIVDRT